ncbi:glycosyltransferase [Vibrio alfacsensis]|uniref:glycosyltransferase n=1 Tax=Vibrio alfacsensis TaxID=1074311 RepID=UPI0040680ABA
MGKDMNELVSVYLITKNRVELLKKAVDSVLNQSYKNIELIIVDDGSTDGTRSYLNSLSNESRVRVIYNEQSKGACYSRNVAISNAKGKFITGLDDDDYFLPRRVEIFVKNYDDKYSFLCSGWKVEPFSLKSYITHLVKYKYGEINLEQLFYMNHVGNQIFIKRSRLNDGLLFDESQKAWQDYDLWVRLIKSYGPAYKLRSRSQVMNVDRSRTRITTNKNKIDGVRLFYKKYQSEMSDNQKRKIKLILDAYNER